MTHLELIVVHDARMKGNDDDDDDVGVAEEEEEEEEELHSRTSARRSEFVVDEGATTGVGCGCAARLSADSEPSAPASDDPPTLPLPGRFSRGTKGKRNSSLDCQWN